MSSCESMNSYEPSEAIADVQNTWSGTGSACQPCPAGTGSDSGSTSCQACPAGTYSTQGQGCQQCPPDTGSSEGASECTRQCPAGSYLANPPGPDATPTCASCPDGSVAQAGSTSCQSCRIGTAPDATQAQCTPTSTARMDKRSRAQLCLPGFQLCPVGRRGSLECIDTATNLTSCGGCPGSGEDCSARFQNATAQCREGICHYSCPSDHHLTSSGCSRIRRPWDIARKPDRRLAESGAARNA